MAQKIKYNNRIIHCFSYVLLPAVSVLQLVRFILRMELNANPLASEVDPFGRIILMRSPRNLCSRIADTHFTKRDEFHWRAVRDGSKSRSIYQKSLHQKLCNQSAQLLFVSWSCCLNYAPARELFRVGVIFLISFHNQSQRLFFSTSSSFLPFLTRKGSKFTGLFFLSRRRLCPKLFLLTFL